MSPRRRMLLLSLVALLVAVAVGALVVAHRGGEAPPSVAFPRQDRPGPVLLVPGYGGSTGSLEALAGRLRAAGREAIVVRLPGSGTGDLREAARALGAAADQALAGGAPSVDVVGYSAGGVVARTWVREQGGAAKTRRVVTLGSPHHGTEIAAAGAAFLPSACPIACQQLVPDSPLLQALNAGDETPAGPQWLSLWTSNDETVTPPDSARLAGAVDVVLQSVCPGTQLSHGGLPSSPLVTGLVLRALAPAPIVAPRRADCAALTAAGS